MDPLISESLGEKISTSASLFGLNLSYGNTTLVYDRVKRLVLPCYGRFYWPDVSQN